MSGIKETIAKKIADAIEKYHKGFSRIKVLKTIEEVEANTNDTNLVGATVFATLNDNLTFPDGVKFYPDIQNGERGYNTDPARGADTFSPFSGKWEKIYTGSTSAQPSTVTFSGEYDLFTFRVWNSKRSKYEWFSVPKLKLSGESSGDLYYYNYTAFGICAEIHGADMRLYAYENIYVVGIWASKTGIADLNP